MTAQIYAGGLKTKPVCGFVLWVFFIAFIFFHNYTHHMEFVDKTNDYYKAVLKSALVTVDSNQREHAVHLIAGCEAVLLQQDLGLCRAVRNLTMHDLQEMTVPRNHIDSIKATFEDVKRTLYKVAMEFEDDIIEPVDMPVSPIGPEPF